MRSGFNRVFVIVLWALLLPVLARAQAPAGKGGAAPDVGKPGMIGAIAVRSLDALPPVAKELGLPLPPFLTAAGIEQQFGFLGADSVDSTRPIGIIFFGGPGVDAASATAFQFPIKIGVNPLAAVAKQGKPLAGHPDTLVANNVAFRRVKESVVFGAQPELIAALDERLIPNTVAGQTSLAAGWMDIAAIKKAMPEQFGAFIKQIETESAAKNADEALGVEMVVSFFRDKLERVELAIDRSDAGLRIATTIHPFGVKAVGPPALPRPGLPAGALVKAHIGFRLLDALPIDQAFWTNLVNQMDETKHLPVAERKRGTDAVNKVCTLLLGADTTTVGVEPTRDNRSAVVYVVGQYRKPMNFDAELRQTVKDWQALSDPTSGNDAEFQIESYTDGAYNVTRVKILPEGKNKGSTVYLDAVQRGNLVWMTFANDPAKRVAGLADLKPADPAAHPAPAPGAGAAPALSQGSVDIGGFAKVLASSPDGPLAGMPEAQQKKLLDLLAGQNINFSVTSHGDGLTFDVLLPQQLLKNVPELMKMGG